MQRRAGAVVTSSLRSRGVACRYPTGEPPLWVAGQEVVSPIPHRRTAVLPSVSGSGFQIVCTRGMRQWPRG
jgi:hypothetical protein